ncbi:uncharacterized protein LOC131248904 [Magnolia sinica]|uniref:uncharacterized protein LOC131248904 n=1 Tax=Magnolia sinica TaxID=86752 RepID=UPI002658B3F9|nr:uncharacterized protein LOC131248904 [Magnolia sinica]
MPQVDFDHKIICETTLNDDGHERPDIPDPPPDIPVDSFRLPIEDELDWVDRNAYYERKQSTKGNSNSGNLKPIPINLKSKASSIIGLPKRPDSCQLSHTTRRNCQPTTVRFFPRSVPKPTPPESEPASPKVSCIGRIRPKDNKRNAASVKPPPRRFGFWASFLTVIRCHGKPQDREDENSSSKNNKNIPAGLVQVQATVQAPGLVGLKNFASGRRSSSWGGDAELELEMDLQVAEPHSSDKDTVGRRRAVGPPQPVECARDWECSGPASV